ncbi:creatininase family protein [Halorubrum sp. Atlit-8R]|uniref:creatininase family protein n=1 Tax=unclassified Halorubrum TaxID=2642239 RepID=UPI000EF1E7AB|nr:MULTISPECIES: creatininase family protein [unclassified Halorubrum]RLM67368.1 creatininase family protein [Halorubrum sp. Atlit-9R]RLM77528.1 creatininase family protein [Halorubrum sp. Atlit-8R]
MRLSEVTWTDVRDADVDVAFLPVGSTEQHGPHAPLGTDALNAVAVAEAGADAYERAGSDEAADAERGEVAVAPPVPVGVAEEHRAFDGTMWVSPETFRAYVRESAESLVSHGVDRVVFVNGHGGNVEALAEVAQRFSRDDAHAGYGVAFTWFEAVGDHASDMGHAGPLETALLRATNPDLVREERVDEAGAGAADRWGEWVAGVNLAHDSDEFTDNGVVGDPRAGDAERGRELLDRASASLAELAAAVVERDA